MKLLENSENHSQTQILQRILNPGSGSTKTHIECRLWSNSRKSRSYFTIHSNKTHIFEFQLEISISSICSFDNLIHQYSKKKLFETVGWFLNEFSDSHNFPSFWHFQVSDVGAWLFLEKLSVAVDLLDHCESFLCCFDLITFAEFGFSHFFLFQWNTVWLLF